MATVATSRARASRAPRAHDAWRASAYVCSAWLCEIFLLALAWLLAVSARVALGHLFGVKPLAWAHGAGLQYLVSGCVVLAALAYESVHSAGFSGLDQTDRIVKALTAGLAVSVFASFLVQESAALSRSLLVLWYFFNVLVFALVRPVLQSWLRQALGHALEITLVHGQAGDCLAVLNRSRTPVVAHDTDCGLGSARSTLLGVLNREDLSPRHLADWERHFNAVAFLPSGLGLSVLGARAVNLYGMQLFVIDHPLSRAMNRAIKRCFDLSLSVALLLLTAPLLLGIALAIVLDSRGGSAFYGHERMGRNGGMFRVWKFRTMHPDSDRRLAAILSQDEAMRREFEASFKLKRDPRITRLGRILRRFSLDELPQLWNVFCGEMSIVGPRAIVPKEKALYGECAYSLVATIKPGITGIWQTCGRNDVEYAVRGNFDVFYVRSWSFWLDLSILVRTLSVVFLPSGY